MNQILYVGANKTDFREMARGLGTVVRFPVGSSVFREGDPADHMYIVLTGELELHGREKLIERLGPGDSLGIVGLLDEQPRTVTASVTSDSELAVIDRKRFRYMVEEIPNFVWYVMNELVGRLRATNQAL